MGDRNRAREKERARKTEKYINCMRVYFYTHLYMALSQQTIGVSVIVG